jgi:hypothetical protein
LVAPSMEFSAHPNAHVRKVDLARMHHAATHY